MAGSGVVIKQIKPAKLKEDALRLELLNSMKTFGTMMKKEFEKTTKTWKHKPKFEILRALSSNLGKVEVTVETNDEIYGYVNNGTKQHIIEPKKPGGKLSFMWGGPGSYSPKTSPGVIGSQKGGMSGGEKTVRAWVIHPGTEARNFDEMIAKLMQPRFKAQMQDAMKRAAAKSGHGKA
ncbi:MAG: hypothetical protein WC373_14560 [Smithella sp.]|jgi:hypothetical protein